MLSSDSESDDSREESSSIRAKRGSPTPSTLSNAESSTERRQESGRSEGYSSRRKSARTPVRRRETAAARAAATGSSDNVELESVANDGATSEPSDNHGLNVSVLSRAFPKQSPKKLEEILRKHSGTMSKSMEELMNDQSEAKGEEEQQTNAQGDIPESPDSSEPDETRRKQNRNATTEFLHSYAKSALSEMAAQRQAFDRNYRPNPSKPSVRARTGAAVGLTRLEEERPANTAPDLKHKRSVDTVDKADKTSTAGDDTVKKVQERLIEYFFPVLPATRHYKEAEPKRKRSLMYVNKQPKPESPPTPEVIFHELPASPEMNNERNRVEEMESESNIPKKITKLVDGWWRLGQRSEGSKKSAFSITERAVKNSTSGCKKNKTARMSTSGFKKNKTARLSLLDETLESAPESRETIVKLEEEPFREDSSGCTEENKEGEKTSDSNLPVLSAQDIIVSFNDDSEEAPGTAGRNNPDDYGIPGFRLSPNTQGLADFLSGEEQDSLRMILQMFPDIDPHYVVEEIAQRSKSAEGLADHLSRDSGYPKLKSRMEKERRERRREEFLNPESFDVRQYLRIFENPEQYFSDRTRAVSQLYRDHAIAQLLNDFPNMRRDYLTRALEDNNGHYLPTFKMISDGEEQAGVKKRKGVGSRKGSAKKKSRGPVFGPQYLSTGDRVEPEKLPDEIEEIFFRELQFIRYETDIREHLDRQRMARQERMAQARADNALEECVCCMDDECLPEDMVDCAAERHRFCRTCVARHVETQVGEGHHRIKCLSDECDSEISLQSLRDLLRPNVVDLILRRSQEHEIQNAQLENMESCPFCNFAMIIDNREDRVFRCQNPECLKESCRECHEVSHIPLRCNEVEKADETRMRVFVENKMAEAMIRRCPTCDKRIVKSDGCNKMKCPCGTAICYVCQEPLDPVNPYAHFERGGGFFGMMAHGPNVEPRPDAKKACPLHTSINQVNADVAEDAGKSAREAYMKEHPEMMEQKKDVNVAELVERHNDPMQQRHAEAHRILMGRMQRVDLDILPSEQQAQMERRQEQMERHRAALIVQRKRAHHEHIQERREIYEGQRMQMMRERQLETLKTSAENIVQRCLHSLDENHVLLGEAVTEELRHQVLELNGRLNAADADIKQRNHPEEQQLVAMREVFRQLRDMPNQIDHQCQFVQTHRMQQIHIDEQLEAVRGLLENRNNLLDPNAIEQFNEHFVQLTMDRPEAREVLALPHRTHNLTQRVYLVDRLRREIEEGSIRTAPELMEERKRFKELQKIKKEVAMKTLALDTRIDQIVQSVAAKSNNLQPNVSDQEGISSDEKIDQVVQSVATNSSNPQPNVSYQGAIPSASASTSTFDDKRVCEKLLEDTQHHLTDENEEEVLVELIQLRETLDRWPDLTAAKKIQCRESARYILHRAQSNTPQIEPQYPPGHWSRNLPRTETALNLKQEIFTEVQPQVRSPEEASSSAQHSSTLVDETFVQAVKVDALDEIESGLHELTKQELVACGERDIRKIVRHQNRIKDLVETKSKLQSKALNRSRKETESYLKRYKRQDDMLKIEKQQLANFLESVREKSGTENISQITERVKDGFVDPFQATKELDGSESAEKKPIIHETAADEEMMKKCSYDQTTGDIAVKIDQPTSDKAQENNQAVMIQKVEALRKHSQALQDSVKDSQRALAKATDGADRRVKFQILRGLMKQRDDALIALHKAEDCALKNGVSETDLRGENASFNLSLDEISGAVAEAQEAVAKKQAILSKELGRVSAGSPNQSTFIDQLSQEMVLSLAHFRKKHQEFLNQLQKVCIKQDIAHGKLLSFLSAWETFQELLNVIRNQQPINSAKKSVMMVMLSNKYTSVCMNNLVQFADQPAAFIESAQALKAALEKSINEELQGMNEKFRIAQESDEYLKAQQASKKAFSDSRFLLRRISDEKERVKEAAGKKLQKTLAECERTKLILKRSALLFEIKTVQEQINDAQEWFRKEIARAADITNKKQEIDEQIRNLTQQEEDYQSRIKEIGALKGELEAKKKSMPNTCAQQIEEARAKREGLDARWLALQSNMKQIDAAIAVCPTQSPGQPNQQAATAISVSSASKSAQTAEPEVPETSTVEFVDNPVNPMGSAVDEEDSLANDLKRLVQAWKNQGRENELKDYIKNLCPSKLSGAVQRAAQPVAVVNLESDDETEKLEVVFDNRPGVSKEKPIVIEEDVQNADDVSTVEFVNPTPPALSPNPEEDNVEEKKEPNNLRCTVYRCAQCGFHTTTEKIYILHCGMHNLKSMDKTCEKLENTAETHPGSVQNVALKRENSEPTFSMGPSQKVGKPDLMDDLDKTLNRLLTPKSEGLSFSPERASPLLLSPERGAPLLLSPRNQGVALSPQGCIPGGANNRPYPPLGIDRDRGMIQINIHFPGDQLENRVQAPQGAPVDRPQHGIVASTTGTDSVQSGTSAHGPDDIEHMDFE